MTDEANKFGTGTFGTQFGAGNVTDAKTLISDIMLQTSISPTDVKYREVVLAFINQVYLTVLKGRHWRFLNKELFMESFAPYQVGTVAVVQGTHIIEEENGTFGIVFNVAHKGQLLSVGSSDDYYRILEIITNKKIEVNPGYTGVTDTSTSYKIYNDRITLSSVVQDIKSMSVTGQWEMKPLGLQQFRTKKGLNPTLCGIPEWFTVVEEQNQDGAQVVEVFPSPDKRYGYHIEYTERPTRLEDSETCFLSIPPEHMDVMILGGRAGVYEDQNNIALATSVGQKAASAWNRMAGDQELTDSRARVKQGRNYFHRRASRANVSFGTRFFGRFD